MEFEREKMEEAYQLKQKKKGNRFSQWLHSFGKQWQLQVMTLPGVIFLLIFGFLPMYGLIIAFKNMTVVDTIWSAPWVGWENFQIIKSDHYFWSSVVNTLGISLLKLLIEFPLSIIFALMIYELRDSIFKRVVQTISYLPHFISWIILGGMIITWMSTQGLFNQLLGFVGIHSSANHMLDTGAYWWIAALSDTWKEVGWGTILYLAAMAKIDPTFYEAAKMDGASRVRMIWSITLPNIRGMIALNTILWVSGIFGSNLDQTLVLMNAQNQPNAEVINSYVYRVGLVQGNFSYATAVGLGVSIISLILLVAANFATKKLNDNNSML